MPVTPHLNVLGDQIHAASKRAIRRQRRLRIAGAAALLAITASTIAVAGDPPWESTTPPASLAPTVTNDSPAAPPSETGAVISDARSIARRDAERRSRGELNNTSVRPIGAPADQTAHVVLRDLGAGDRTLALVATAGGGVCLSLTGLPTECVPGVPAGEHLGWFVAGLKDGSYVAWGFAGDAVASIDVVTPDGTTTHSQLASNAFYAETPVKPSAIITHLSDGTEERTSL